MIHRLVKKGSRGASIIEALIAVTVVFGGFLVVATLMAASLRLSVQSRNRTYAYLVAESTVEMLNTHRYGEPQPDFWTEPEYSRVIVEGAPQVQVTEFKKKFSYKNGSFIGKSDEDYDRVTVEITWTEGAGSGGQPRTHKLTVYADVRRNAQ